MTLIPAIGPGLFMPATQRITYNRSEFLQNPIPETISPRLETNILMNLSTQRTLTPPPLRKAFGLLSTARIMALALNTVTSKCQRSAFSFSRKRLGAVLPLLFLFVFCAETKSQIPNASPRTQLISAAGLRETRQPPLISADKRSGDDQARSGSKGFSVLRSFALLPIRLVKAVAGALKFGEGKGASIPAPAKSHDDASVLARYDSGKPLDWVPVKFEVDGKEKHGRYKILLYLKDGQPIEPLLVDGGFIVPPEIKSSEYVTVRFLSGRYDLSFDGIYPAKFETDWTVGVDTKPFDSANVWEDEAARKTRIIYFIDFESKVGDGTRMVVRVPIKDSTSKSNLQETSIPQLAIGGMRTSAAMTVSSDFTSCGYWQAMVDPTATFDATGWKVDESDPQVIVSAIQCLLQMEGHKELARFSGAQNHSVSQIFEPATVDVAALYYISYLYHQNWDHANAIALRDENGDVNSPEAIHTAYLSYRQWFEQVKALGLDKAREAKLDPLAGTKVSWY